MNIAIILSGGVGSRMGASIPKQYIEVNDRPIIDWSVSTFAARADIAKIVIVAAQKWLDYLKARFSHCAKSIVYADVGESRQLSVCSGLKAAISSGCSADDIVIIHEAARPLVSNKIIDDCIHGVEEGFDGVMPALRVKDTIYVSNDGMIISGLLERGALRAGQSPESFRLGSYLALNEKMPRDELLRINGSAELAFKSGQKVKIVDGDEDNFKITTPPDLARFKQIVAGRIPGEQWAQ